MVILSLNIVSVFILLSELCIATCAAKLNAEPVQDICLLGSDLVLERPLMIGAWNSQRFGKAKIAKSHITDYMAKIMVRYDIIALQEVTDSSQESIYEFLDILNYEAYLQSPSYDPEDILAKPPPTYYNVSVSERVGSPKSWYKEQYPENGRNKQCREICYCAKCDKSFLADNISFIGLYINIRYVVYYRSDVVQETDNYQYDDINDQFKYDPYVVTFKTPTISIDELALVVIHTTPDNAGPEIDALVDVHDTVYPRTGVKDVIILGDFNAGCSYVTGNDWEHIRLFNETLFSWLITDHIDTTAKSTTCPYDRIVVAGPHIGNLTYEGSAQAFHFDEFLGLNDTDTIKSISDHFPVEFQIKGKLKSELKPTLSVNVKLPSSVASINDMYRACKNDFDQSAHSNRTTTSCGGIPTSITQTSDITLITFQTKSQEETFQLLEQILALHRCIINTEVTAILQYKMSNGVLLDSSLYAHRASPEEEIQILCIQNICTISVTTLLEIA